MNNHDYDEKIVLFLMVNWKQIEYIKSTLLNQNGYQLGIKLVLCERNIYRCVLSYSLPINAQFLIYLVEIQYQCTVSTC